MAAPEKVQRVNVHQLPNFQLFHLITASVGVRQAIRSILTPREESLWERLVKCLGSKALTV